MFRPLINSIFDAVSVGIDAYANFIYRLVEGRSYQEAVINEAIENVEEFLTSNIVEYKYIPTQEFNLNKIDKKIIFEFK